MAKKNTNVHAYGDLDGAVWVTSPGVTTTLEPTGLYPDAPGPEFTEAGWTSEDGVTEGHKKESSEVKAWPGGVTVRTLFTSDNRTFKIQFLEENSIVLGLMRPGSPVDTTASGLVRTRVKVSTGRDLRSWVIDVADGTTKNRKFIPYGEVSETADVAYQNKAVTVYEATVTCYPNSDGELYVELSNNAALAPSTPAPVPVQALAVTPTAHQVTLTL